MKLKFLIALVLPFAFTTFRAKAVTFMLDFGPTTVTGMNLTNSPYHSVNGSEGTSWNKITTPGDADNVSVPDVTSGLLFSNGTAATGVGVNLGVATGTIVGLGTQPTRNAGLGGVYNTTIYSAGSVGRDGILSSTGVALGAQITGLAAGDYDVYLSTRNTNYNTLLYKQISYVGAGTAGANYDYLSYGSSTLSFEAMAATPSTWIEGESYVKLRVTLTAGQALNIAVVGETAAGLADRGFLNSIQIVSVPEPTYGALLCGGMVAFAFRRGVRRA